MQLKISYVIHTTDLIDNEQQQRTATTNNEQQQQQQQRTATTTFHLGTASHVQGSIRHRPTQDDSKAQV